MNNMLSISRLANVFTNLAQTNPSVIDHYRQRFDHSSRSLKMPPFDRLPQGVAQIMSELFMPSKVGPIEGLSIPSIKGDAPVVHRTKNLEVLKEDPMAFLNGGGSLDSQVISVSIDPANHKRSTFSFKLKDKQTCALEVLEETGQVTVSLSGGKRVTIDDATRKEKELYALDLNLSGLISLKEDVLKQHEAAASN